MRRVNVGNRSDCKDSFTFEACKDLFWEYPSHISDVEKILLKFEARRAAGLRVTEIGAVGGNRLILNYEGQPAVIWRWANLKPLETRLPKALS